MLTVTTGFAPSTGVLTVNISAANEAAVVDIVNGNVLVNGSQVANGTAANTTANSVNQIVIAGTTAANQDVTLAGDFSSTGLDSVSATNVDDVSFSGNLTLSGDLTVNATGRIIDGFTTQINVNGLATVFGDAGVRLGDNGADVFNAGTVNFRSTGQVSINEDSSINIVGNNTARSVSLRTRSTITDAANAQTNIQFQSGFTAASVQIGDTDTDAFNSNSIYFFTTGRFDLSEDSDTLIIEEKNFAQSLRLRSTGQITDEAVSRVTVTNLAEFDAQSAVIGDVGTDFFTAGSIQYNVATQFRLTENDDTNILGVNRAQNSIVTSVGDLSNSEDADIVITNNASFRGNAINIGNQAGDNAQFGSLTFITPNVGVASPPAGFAFVNITEDDSTVFGGNSSAGQAADATATPAVIGSTGTVRIQSGGSITDGSNSSVNVNGNVRLTTANNGNITLGDSGVNAAGVAFNSTFNAGSLTVDTDGTGNVRIFEDSAIFLVGNNQANSLLLDANNGQSNITDSRTAQINVNSNLNVRGALVNLGTGVDENDSTISTDLLSFSTLTFNTTGNTTISADSNIGLRGTSSADNLTLASTGNITDQEIPAVPATPTSPAVSAVPARTTAITSANFSAIDAIIGESGTDFFEIVNPANAPGLADVSGEANVVENRI